MFSDKDKERLQEIDDFFLKTQHEFPDKMNTLQFRYLIYTIFACYQLNPSKALNVAFLAASDYADAYSNFPSEETFH